LPSARAALGDPRNRRRRRRRMSPLAQPIMDAISTIRNDILAAQPDPMSNSQRVRLREAAIGVAFRLFNPYFAPINTYAHVSGSANVPKRKIIQQIRVWRGAPLPAKPLLAISHDPDAIANALIAAAVADRLVGHPPLLV